MDAFLIQGPCRLKGKVKISGSKNTSLPMLFSSLLFDEPVTFENIPRLWDIETTASLLESIGAEVQWDKESNRVSILPRIQTPLASYEWVKKMRAGILALGPLLAKRGEAKVSLPGGCAIGARPVDFHLEALRKMGASIEVEEGYVKAKVAKHLQGATIQFPLATVTGTENILMAAVLAEGETILENAAREPEVTALANFLVSSGIEIQGIGTSRLVIKGGTPKFPKAPVTIPADRIEAGTWLAAAVATSSEIEIENFPHEEMGTVLDAVQAMGVQVKHSREKNSIAIIPCESLRPVDLETQPYPGFPTDMQAQMMVAMTQASGKSRIRETIFENRFMHVAELKRLGADISVQHTEAIINGRNELIGAPLMATDLRASASLVIAALCARGMTRISRIYHLDRGYQKLDRKLEALGANVQRILE